MKVELTYGWDSQTSLDPRSSIASWGQIHLQCSYIDWNSKGFIGLVCIGGFHQRQGPVRRSAKLAQQDAEVLAVELLRDIRDGTKALMDQYGMGDDD